MGDYFHTLELSTEVTISCAVFSVINIYMQAEIKKSHSSNMP